MGNFSLLVVVLFVSLLHSTYTQLLCPPLQLSLRSHPWCTSATTAVVTDRLNTAVVAVSASVVGHTDV